MHFDEKSTKKHISRKKKHHQEKKHKKHFCFLKTLSMRTVILWLFIELKHKIYKIHVDIEKYTSVHEEICLEPFVFEIF